MKNKILFIIFSILNTLTTINALNYYETLELPTNASADEIRTNYKKLALKYHPDKNPSKDAQNKFIDISDAYKVLSDPEAKKNYDKNLNNSKIVELSPNKKEEPTQKNKNEESTQNKENLNPNEEITSSEALKNALKELITIGQIALTLPNKFKNIKEDIKNLDKLSPCIVNPKSSKCDKNLCQSSRKICLGLAFGSFAKLLEQATSTLLGNVETKNNIKQYKRGIIPSILYLMPQFIPQFIKALPNSITKNSLGQTSINILRYLTDIINSKVMPNMANITEYLQLSTSLLEGLSFSLAPLEVIKQAPEIEIPPLEINVDKQDEPEFNFE